MAKAKSSTRGPLRGGAYMGGKGLTAGQRRIGKNFGPKGKKYFQGRGLTRSQRKVK